MKKWKPCYLLDIVFFVFFMISFLVIAVAPFLLSQFRKTSFDLSFYFGSALKLLMIPLYQVSASYSIMLLFFKIGMFNVRIHKKIQIFIFVFCGISIFLYVFYIIQIFVSTTRLIWLIFAHAELAMENVGFPFLVGALLFLGWHNSPNFCEGED